MGPEKKQVIPFNKKPVANAPKNASYNDINASSGPAEPQMDEDDLRVAVARIVRNGTYEERKHSSKDRAYRNISDDDIQSCLTGEFSLSGTEMGEDSRGRKYWKYTIRGKDIEGDELSLVITVNKETQRIAIITKF